MAVALRPCICLILLLAAGGCERQAGPRDTRLALYPVRGRVSVDGYPAEGAFVVFHPEHDPADPDHPRPHATVRAGGSFVLGTYEEGDGAPAGNYVVTVVWAAGPRDGDRLAGRYSSPAHPQLRTVVLKGPNDLPEFLLR
jgi:hypothetical protein